MPGSKVHRNWFCLLILSVKHGMIPAEALWVKVYPQKHWFFSFYSFGWVPCKENNNIQRLLGQEEISENLPSPVSIWISVPQITPKLSLTTTYSFPALWFGWSFVKLSLFAQVWLGTLAQLHLAPLHVVTHRSIICLACLQLEGRFQGADRRS